MDGGRNEEARGARARRAIGWVLAVLALALLPSVVPGWSAGGRVQAGEPEGRSGPLGRDRARRGDVQIRHYESPTSITRPPAFRISLRS